jgi:hypothetical protein
MTALPSFTNNSRYGKLIVKRATATHAGELQHLLRLTDIRECMIQGSSPWRALHQPLTTEHAETFTALVGKTPICMGGVSPLVYEDGCYIGSIWLLGSPAVEEHAKDFHKMVIDMVDYFQDQYDILENVVPVEHIKSIRWLSRLGFVFAQDETLINGFAVRRFVRCAPEYSVSFEDNDGPRLTDGPLG